MHEEKDMQLFSLPTLALRGLAVYPKMMVHFDVGREMSIKALEEAMSKNQYIFLVAQKDIRVEMPDKNQLFSIGTVSAVRQILRLPGKNVRVNRSVKHRHPGGDRRKSDTCGYGQVWR